MTTAQQGMQRTGGIRRHFQAFFWLRVYTCFRIGSHSSHPLLTPAIERLETHAPRQRRGGARLEGTFDSRAVAERSSAMESGAFRARGRQQLEPKVLRPAVPVYSP